MKAQAYFSLFFVSLTVFIILIILFLLSNSNKSQMQFNYVPDYASSYYALLNSKYYITLSDNDFIRMTLLDLIRLSIKNNDYSLLNHFFKNNAVPLNLKIYNATKSFVFSRDKGDFSCIDDANNFQFNYDTMNVTLCLDFDDSYNVYFNVKRYFSENADYIS